MRPIYHHTKRRVEAHIFVAALALLLKHALGRKLQQAGLDLSAEEALGEWIAPRSLWARIHPCHDHSREP